MLIVVVTLPPELRQAPELALFEEQIRAILEDERPRRAAFRDQLRPDVKAEFINGEIVVHSPATYKHNQVRHHLARLLSCYADTRKCGVVLDEKALIALTRNDYEPDINFFGTGKASQLTAAQLHFPAPDLIVEVLSESTEGRDRGVKFRDYPAHGVAEYWLVDPTAEVVEQYENVDSQYKLLLKLNNGVIASRVVPAFEIPVRAIFNPDENLAALRRIMSV